MSTHPVRFVTHQLLYTTTGTVWAGWRLDPLAYGLRPVQEKREARLAHTALLRALRGEFLMTGICVGTDPAAVVEAMISGVGLDRHPEWAAECEASLDVLEHIALGERVYYLWQPLPNRGNERLLTPLRAAEAQLRSALAMPLQVPSRADIASRLAQAELLRKSLPRVFSPRPVTAAEVAWLSHHQVHRGTPNAALAVPQDPTSDQLWTPATSAALAQPLLDEGAQTDHKGPLDALTIASRPLLKVIDSTTLQPSYQAMLTVANTPPGGHLFPGMEWIGEVDESGLVADWAIRGRVRSRAEVSQRNRRASANIADQVDQRSGDTNIGAMGVLDLSLRDLGEYQALIDSDHSELEVEATTVFSISSGSEQSCRDDARELTKYFADRQFRLTTEIAGQEDLWWSTQPGSPINRVTNDRAQITTAFAFAAAMPLISASLGQRTGHLFALQSAGRPTPVLVDLETAASELDTAPSIGLVGELGAGKSVGMKKICGDHVDRGATLLAIDRTAMGEWATWADSIRDDAQIISITEDAELSTDPLRLFSTGKASRVAQTFLTTLLNLDPTEPMGATLGRILEPSYLAEHQIASMGALLAHLREGCEIEGADQLGHRIGVFATKDIGRAVFDPLLPTADMSASIVVYRTNELALPGAEETNLEHRFRQMSIEKRMGRAVHVLIAAVAKEVCFADRTQLAIFACDEAHAITRAPEGAEILIDFNRDGRKHKAGLIVGSHDPEEDFGSTVLRHLIPMRVVLRHRDPVLAARALRWLFGQELDAEVDPDLVRWVTEGLSPVPPGEDSTPQHRRGEALMRDFRGRYGPIKILTPAHPRRASAIGTTPPSATDLAVA